MRSVQPPSAQVPSRRLRRWDKLARPDYLVFFCFCLSLIADGANQRATTLPIPRVVSRDLPISPRFMPTSFYRDAGSALPIPRQPMVELFVLTSSRFPLRKSELKITPAETRTHKFRLSGRKLYPLGHRATLKVAEGRNRQVINWQRATRSTKDHPSELRPYTAVVVVYK